MILVIEPDDELQELVCSWLRSAGYQTIAADSLREGLVVLAKSGESLFRTVVCATNVASPRPHEAWEHLKHLQSDLKIVLTGATKFEDPSTRSIHDYTYLEKPFGKNELMAAINISEI